MLSCCNRCSGDVGVRFGTFKNTSAVVKDSSFADTVDLWIFQVSSSEAISLCSLSSELVVRRCNSRF